MMKMKFFRKLFGQAAATAKNTASKTVQRTCQCGLDRCEKGHAPLRNQVEVATAVLTESGEIKAIKAIKA